MRGQYSIWSKIVPYTVLFLCLNISFSSAAEPILWSFEASEDIEQWGRQYQAGIERTQEYATEGKYSAKVTFPPANYPGIFVYPQQTDWTDYVYLVLDVYNPQKEAYGLAVQLSDVNGENFVLHLYIQGESLLSFKKRVASITKTKHNFDLRKVKKSEKLMVDRL